MKSLKIILLTAAMLVPSFASAEHAIGFSAGITKGVGLTYRNINEDTGLGVQITGIPVALVDSGFLSGGIQGILLLSMSKTGKAFLSLGAGAIHSWNAGESATLIGVGPGIGFEFQVAKSVGLSLELPIAAIYGAESVTENGVKKIKLGLRGVTPIPSASLVYIW
tara:strand:- start:263 stop:757 length:495 start_codon:yes stop_codon:yes gene_type:complete